MSDRLEEIKARQQETKVVTFHGVNLSAETRDELATIWLQMSDDIDTLLAEVARLEAETSALDATWGENRTTITNLQAINEVLRQESDRLTAEIAKLNKDNVFLQVVSGYHIDQARKLRTENERLLAEVDRLSATDDRAR